MSVVSVRWAGADPWSVNDSGTHCGPWPACRPHHGGGLAPPACGLIGAAALSQVLLGTCLMTSRAPGTQQHTDTGWRLPATRAPGRMPQASRTLPAGCWMGFCWFSSVATLPLRLSRAHTVELFSAFLFELPTGLLMNAVDSFSISKIRLEPQVAARTLSDPHILA